MGLQKVNNDDDAVSLMNDTQYGLTAAIYGIDEERCTAMLRDVNVGTCYWNACDRVSPYLPWTGLFSHFPHYILPPSHMFIAGVKHSGFGSTLGLDGIRNFLRPRAWHLRKPTPKDTTSEFNAANTKTPITYDEVTKSSLTKEGLELKREADHPQPGPLRTKL